MIVDNEESNASFEDGAGLYHCLVCNTSFESCRIFMQHVTTHSAEETAEPPLTGIASTSQPTAPNGMDQVDGKPLEKASQVQCSQCSRYFMDSRALKIHVNKAHTDHRTVRPLTFHLANGVNESSDPTSSALVDTSAACDECGRRFPTPKQAKVHRFKSHIEPRRKNELFLQKQLLEAEMTKGLKEAVPDTHKEDPPTKSTNEAANSKPGEEKDKSAAFQCVECSMTFPSPRSLATHKFKAHVEPNMPGRQGLYERVHCAHCERYFGSDKALKIHVMKAHTAPDRVAGSNGLAPSLLSIGQPLRPLPARASTAAHPPTMVPMHGRDSSLELGTTIRSGVECGNLVCENCQRSFTRMNNLYRHRKLYCTALKTKTSTSGDTGVDAQEGEEDVSGREDSSCEGNLVVDTEMKEDHHGGRMKTSSQTSASATSTSGVGGQPPVPSITAYPCPKCSKAFRLRAVLKRHLLVHEHGKAFQCDKCSAAFTRKYNLNLHKQYKCVPRVKKSSNNEASGSKTSAQVTSVVTAKHAATAGEKRRFRCPRCGIGFNHASNMYTHVKRYCRQRNDTLAQASSSLKQRRRNRQPSPPHDEQKVETVVKGDNIIPILNCPHCTRTFETPKALTTHRIRTHDDLAFPNGVPCGQCPKQFPSPRALAVHRVRAHGETPVSNVKRVRCPVCKKRFRNPLTMEAHKQLHDKEAAIRLSLRNAEETKQSSSTEPTLPAPPSVSNKITPAIEAKKAGDSSLHLDTSLRSPDGQYKCGMCARLFISRLSLTGHLKSHLQEDSKPHGCPGCARRFTSLNNLRYHGSKFCPALLTSPSPKVRPGRGLQCLHCPIVLSNRAAMEQHAMQAHTQPGGSGRISCFKCTRTFPLYVNFRIHMTTAHQKKSTTKTTCLDSTNQSTSSMKPPPSLPKRKSDTIKSTEELVCPKCLRHIKTPNALVMHIRFCKGVAAPVALSRRCSKCSRVFGSINGLLRHAPLCRGLPTKLSKMLPCGTCRSKFVNAEELDLHKTTCKPMNHLGSLQCYMCSRRFDNAKAVATHRRFCTARGSGSREGDSGISPAPKSETMNLLGDGVTRDESHKSTDHISAKEEENTPAVECIGNSESAGLSHRFDCRSCERDFKSPKALYAHRRFCSPKRRSKQCLSSTSMKAPGKPVSSCLNKIETSLGNALDVTNESLNEPEHGRPIFPCDLCPRTFHRPAALGTHRRHHLVAQQEEPVPEGAFACEDCDRRFATVFGLGAHSRSHRVEQLKKELVHPCPMCDRRFSSRTKLYYHQSWYCDVGGQGGAQQDRGMIGVNYGCAICGIMFSSQSRLEKHRQLQHAEYVPIRKRARLNESMEELDITVVDAANESTPIPMEECV